jgi:hypothetical protein
MYITKLDLSNLHGTEVSTYSGETNNPLLNRCVQ